MTDPGYRVPRKTVHGRLRQKAITKTEVDLSFLGHILEKCRTATQPILHYYQRGEDAGASTESRSRSCGISLLVELVVVVVVIVVVVVVVVVAFNASASEVIFTAITDSHKPNKRKTPAVQMI